jgi:hypothetical protein
MYWLLLIPCALCLLLVAGVYYVTYVDPDIEPQAARAAMRRRAHGITGPI